jgi:cytochrome c biogenesis protein CcmG, thiol:disulfide interchange protein DsbE
MLNKNILLSLFFSLIMSISSAEQIPDNANTSENSVPELNPSDLSKDKNKNKDRKACFVAPSKANWCLLDDNGNLTSSNQFNGTPYILHFWATWCPYCKKLQPGIKRLQAQFDIKVVAISWSEDDGAKPGQELKARGLDFISLIEGDMLASVFAVKSTPITYVIDKDGEPIYMTNSSDPINPDLIQAVTALYE